MSTLFLRANKRLEAIEVESGIGGEASKLRRNLSVWV